MEWIKYGPKGKDTKFDSKMHLRNMVNYKEIMLPNIPINMVMKSDFGNDEYSLEYLGGQVQIRASENGQKNNAEPGIYFLAEPSDKDGIEEILMKIFK